MPKGIKNMIYAYCRVSTTHQRITRQITNITALYPNATIIKEFYTGTRQDRPNWNKLMHIIKKEDTIVFDSVSRMSRNAEEGFKDYQMLYHMGIHLIFLNEPLINTSVFDSTRNNLLKVDISTGNAAVDAFLNGNLELINNLMMALAEEQIKAAFDQSEKEVTDLHSRISQGIREAKKNGTQIGLVKGTKLTTKKSLECRAIIQKHSKDFGGTLEDPDVIKLCGCSRNSYYKYKKEAKWLS
jgi:DNA invertase Pin-like site-specific DNA recombinase